MTHVSNVFGSPSAVESTRERDVITLTASAGRPVRFKAKIVKNAFVLRTALQSLAHLIWSRDMWNLGDDSQFTLDPVVTVHPDRLYFEAFSQDQSAYGALIVERGVFEDDGNVEIGTTNVDLAAWMMTALGEIRSSRETWLKIAPEGVDVSVTGVGGRFERKVEMPDGWVSGLLKVQTAMALPGVRLSVRPVDMVKVLDVLRARRSRVMPRGMRYVFEPGQDAQLVLEPWEIKVPLVGAAHEFSEAQSMRVFGRKRLSLLEPVLPYAQRVDVFLKGGALPTFYAVKLPGMTFVLGMTGWAGENYTVGNSFDHLSCGVGVDDATVEKAYETLAKWHHISVGMLSETLGRSKRTALRALERLCRQGRAMYDVEKRDFRHRELFAKPIDEAKFFPEDDRVTAATGFLSKKDEVSMTGVAMVPTRRTRTIQTPLAPGAPASGGRRDLVQREWHLKGKVAGMDSVEVMTDDSGRVVFGRCACNFYREHLMKKGPCEHMLALMKFGEPLVKDLPTNMANNGVTHLAVPRGEADAAPVEKKKEEEVVEDEDDSQSEPA
jgi:hypothetical protein